MWHHETPCQDDPDLFTVRRGGESLQTYVSRAKYAQSICNLKCDYKADCALYAEKAEVTGICAGLMFDQGALVKPWPPKRRTETPVRRNECCMECNAEYMTQKQERLCPPCRRKATLFWQGGDANDDESSSSSDGCGYSHEAA